MNLAMKMATTASTEGRAQESENEVASVWKAPVDVIQLIIFNGYHSSPMNTGSVMEKNNSGFWIKVVYRSTQLGNVLCTHQKYVSTVRWNIQILLSTNLNVSITLNYFYLPIIYI